MPLKLKAVEQKYILLISEKKQLLCLRQGTLIDLKCIRIKEFCKILIALTS
jgi:hypothetical protein